MCFKRLGPEALEKAVVAKHRVKAGKAIQWMRADVGGRSVKRVIMLSQPLQEFLNTCFACDKRTTNLTVIATATPVYRQRSEQEADFQMSWKRLRRTLSS